MRPLRALALTAAIWLGTSPARAQDDKPALAFAAGATTMLAGFVAGGLLLGAAGSDADRDNAGWLTIEAGFAAAPVVSHGVAGLWARGALFAAPPVAAWAGTAALFSIDPRTVDHGSIGEQRIMWSLFGAGLLSAAAGVVDAALTGGGAPSAGALAIAPVCGPGRLGLGLGGAL